MRPIEIFFSYSHKDRALMDVVRRQLIVFEREGLITKFYDGEILPGQELESVISERLQRAKTILLFVSPHFIESKYCYNKEMLEALKRHERGKAKVIPIILRPCLWKNAPFGKLLALPEDSRPITKWRNRDEAALSVAEGIKKVVRELVGGAKTPAARKLDINKPVVKKTSWPGRESRNFSCCIRSQQVW
jgi:TIR domain